MNIKSNKRVLQPGVSGFVFVAFRGLVLAAAALSIWQIARWEIVEPLRHFPLWLLIAQQVTLLLGCFAILGRWMPSVLLWVLGVEALRAFSGVKVKYLATPLDASDFRQFDFSSISQTLLHYPGLVGAVALGLVFVVFGVAVWRRFGPEASLRSRTIVCVFVFGLAGVQYQARMALVPPAEAMNSTASVSFVQSFFLEEPDLAVPALAVRPMSVSCPSQPPNIMVVLEESTFKSKEVDRSRDVKLAKFFDGNLFSGPLNVHVYGGKTHLSDFAFLVGVPHTALSGAKEYLSRTLPGRVGFSLPQILHQCGYESTVIYPIGKGYFNSYDWFRSVGFDHVVAPEDLGLAGDGRWKVQDQQFFAQALQRAGVGEKPQLIYVLTIAQHGPHDLQGDAGEEYHRRLTASAAAFGSLGQGLERLASRRPWLLGWFGDHRPFRVEEDDSTHRYTTWASLRWVGSPVPAVQLPQSTDIAFLSRMIQRVAGIGTGSVGAIEDNMMDACPSGYFDCPEDLRHQHQEALRAAGAVRPPGRR